MKSFEIVVVDVTFQGFRVVLSDGAFKAFVLYRSVESFDVGIVVRFSDPRVPVVHVVILNPVVEEFLKLRSVVCLEHAEGERGIPPRFFEKHDCRTRVAFAADLGISPPRDNINEGEDVHAGIVLLEQMDGVQLHKIPRFFGKWTRHVHPMSRPFAASFREIISIERSLDRAERHGNIQ